MSCYIPFNYEQINVVASSYSPSMVKSFNNKTYAFWERSLFQRACSVLQFELPDEWQGSVRDFFYFCLFKYGYVGVFDNEKYGLTFQPGSLSGYDLYYQPTRFLVSNPAFDSGLELNIHDDCELIKMIPDYCGVWDIISYYAEKLSALDNAINMSIINNKFAYILGARNKTAAEALKKLMDKINRGEPAVVYDIKLLNDPQDKDIPFQFLERKDLKSSYLTTDQLLDFQTLLNNFDTEIGIPVLPYQKKERMVTSEAEGRIIDSTSRSVVWYETLQSSLKVVNEKFNTNISVELRYKNMGGESDGKDNT